MTNQNFWLWFAAHAWALAILGATMLEALFIWAYRGDLEPEPWAPNVSTEEL